jgi:drug/metabolite transporter (DMT)-like permease
MLALTLGILAAFAAATFYSLGFALQATEAREAPGEEHLRLALARRLVTRVRWLGGTGLSVLGWPLQLLALSLAPLVVVAPAMAMGLPVLMVFGERMLGERAGRYEHLAVGAIVLGVIGIGLCAPPRTDVHAHWSTLALVLTLLALASLLPYALLRLGRTFALVTMLGAGFAFGWSAVATKLASDDLHHGYLVVAAAWGLSTAGASAIASLSEMSSLQSRPAILVAPVVFVTQTVVPVVLAPLLFGEHFDATPLHGWPLIAALAVLVAGAAALTRSPLLLALMEAERSKLDSGSTPSESERSQATSRVAPCNEAGEPSRASTSTSPARSGR